MSRLDQHVAAVQNKLALERFVHALVWTLFAFAALVAVDILVSRLFHYQISQPRIWFWSACGAAGLSALVWAILKRPSRKAAAVAIDQKLGLHEKVSTALYMRNSTDPFAIAAVKDAENTAGKVAINYWQHFPLRIPNSAWGTGAMAAVALLLFAFLPQLDVLGHEANLKHVQEVEAQKAQAQNTVKLALATVETVPKSLQNDEAIRKAQIDLQNLAKQP